MRRSFRRVTPDDLLRFFAGRQSRKPRYGKTLNPEEWTLTNTPTGLGDSLMLTDHFGACQSVGRQGMAWVTSPYFSQLLPFIPSGPAPENAPFQVSLSAMQAKYDLGPGHNFQRCRRLFGLPVDYRPGGSLVVPGVRPGATISLHFQAGPHSQNQRCYHKQPRQVYPQNLEIIRRFIRNHPDYSFIEIGGSTLSDLVPTMIGPLKTVVEAMAKCCLHIGIISGPYHLAHALGVRTIAVINFPAPWELMLPCVRNVDVVEAEWIYPQTHVLHQDHDSAHWPLFSEYSLEAAFHRETYPYDKPDRFLELINA